jgi:hypothetical protein
MKKFKMIALSAPIKGRENEFNKWYQNVHLPEVVSAKGFKNAQRYRLTTTLQGNAYPYLTIYEIETDDIGKSLAEVGSRATTMSDAIDVQGAYACIYEVCDVPVEHDDAVKR